MIAPSAKAALAGAAVLVVGSALYAWHVRAGRRASREASVLSAAVASGAPVLHVPHAPGPITLDGDTDDPGWLRRPGPARTGDFLFEDGRNARPYSDTRLVWSGDYLYLSLYASDQDIESHTEVPDAPIPPEDDFFHVVFAQGDTEYAFDITPKALITDARRTGDGPWDVAWNAGAHASCEIDGKMNDPRHKDEEWGIELAVPFEAVGMTGERGENVGMSIRRCDIPKGAPRICAGWGEGSGGHPRGRVVLD